jgi:hypothetical protein
MRKDFVILEIPPLRTITESAPWMIEFQHRSRDEAAFVDGSGGAASSVTGSHSRCPVRTISSCRGGSELRLWAITEEGQLNLAPDNREVSRERGKQHDVFRAGGNFG